MTYNIAILLTILMFMGLSTSASSLVPAYFILGDSLADPGNNNYLPTLAKSNFPPYGMQFDTGLPTGRFSNGRTSLDYLGSFLGLPLLPAYLDPSTKGEQLLRGVNFASAGAGIIKSTGLIFGEVLQLGIQVEHFRKVKQEISELLGAGPANELIRKSILTVLIGSNDYINNYLLKASKEANLLTPSQFQELLVTTYVSQAQKLLALGVRKLHLINIPPVGCIPRSLSLYKSKNGECIQFVNELAANFNTAFKAAVARLRASNPRAQIVLTDAYTLFLDLYLNPAAYGFTYASTACCGLGRFNGGFLCLPGVYLCKDADQHEFFDSFHTTDRANKIIASILFNGGNNINYPMNISQLAEV